MTPIRMSTTIQAPPERAFAAFADFPHAARSVSGIERIEMLTDGPVGAGTRFRETRIMFGREATEEMKVTRRKRFATSGVTPRSRAPRGSRP